MWVLGLLVPQQLQLQQQLLRLLLVLLKSGLEIGMGGIDIPTHTNLEDGRGAAGKHFT